MIPSGTSSSGRTAVNAGEHPSEPSAAAVELRAVDPFSQSECKAKDHILGHILVPPLCLVPLILPFGTRANVTLPRKQLSCPVLLAGKTGQ